LADEEDHDDGASEASSSGLPPPLITADEYEALVCRSCVIRIPILRKYAGTPDALAVVRKSSTDPWTVVGRASDVGADVEVDIESGAKRSRAVSEDGNPASKRMKLDGDNVQNGASSSTSPCLAPEPSQEIQSLLQRVEKGDYELFAGDLFLTDDFRDRWCKCTSVRPTTRYPRRTVLERDLFSSVRSR
jgi:E3 ubiquitin-protein ligase UBR7